VLYPISGWASTEFEKNLVGKADGAKVKVQALQRKGTDGGKGASKTVFSNASCPGFCVQGFCPHKPFSNPLEIIYRKKMA
jgi:hypothetical protein